MTELAINSTTGYVVSDLHIFGSSSLYARHLTSLYDAIAQHSVVVLNGDTFDFKRSIYSSASHTTNQALAWLKNLCERSPTTTIHYIVGNHDCQHELVEGIDNLTSSHHNLHLHETSTRIGRCLFVHGDILDAKDAQEGLSEIRMAYQDLEPSRMSKVYGHLVTYLRLNAVEYLRHHKRKVVPKLLQHIKDTQPQLLSGVSSVYFGHTHVPFTDFICEGFKFHNTGSLIRGLAWLPLEFPL